MEQHPHLGRSKMALTLNTVSRSPVFCMRLNQISRDHLGQAHLSQVITDFDAWEAIDRCQFNDHVERLALFLPLT